MSENFLKEAKKLHLADRLFHKNLKVRDEAYIDLAALCNSIADPKDLKEENLLRDAKSLPWDYRLFHKKWKVRNAANIDLTAFCDSIADPKDSRLREFGPLFRKTLADSNPLVQEKALDALIAFLRAADADARRYAKEVCDAIVAKCLTGMLKTEEKAQAAFMLWVELDAVDVVL